MAKIKWTDANVTPAPEGTLAHGIVDKVDYIAASQTSGQPMFKVKIKISDPDEYENRILFRNFSLQGQALFGLKQWANRWGAPEGLFEDDDMDTDEMIKHLSNLEGDMILGVQEYPKDSGELQNYIKSFPVPATV